MGQMLCQSLGIYFLIGNYNVYMNREYRGRILIYERMEIVWFGVCLGVGGMVVVVEELFFFQEIVFY